MRIAYTCHDSFPASSTNTQQIFWTVLELARLGVSVELIVPAIIAARERAREGETGRESGRASLATIAAYYGMSDTVPATLTIRARGEHPAHGALGKGRFDWSAVRQLGNSGASASRRPDVLWTRDALAALSSVQTGQPTIFETYRPDFAARARFSVWRRLCLASPHLRGVVLHSQLAANAYLAAGISADRCLVAHNGFAPSLLEPRLTRAAARARLALPADGPLAVYAGHAGPHKGVEAIIRMAAAVPAARVVLVGVDPNSADARRLEHASRDAGARNVLFRARVPLSEVSAYLYAADCLLIPPTDEPLRRFRRTVLPMKIFMYLAAGRPILAPRLPDVEEVLTDGETARLVSPRDVTEAAAAFAALLSDPALQERLSRGALAASSGYTWAERARRIVEFVTRVVPAPRPSAVRGDMSTASRSPARPRNRQEPG